MKKLLIGCFIFFISSCSKTDCNEEILKLENLRIQGWQRCNGSKSCIDKVEADYNKRVKDLNCN